MVGSEDKRLEKTGQPWYREGPLSPHLPPGRVPPGKPGNGPGKALAMDTAAVTTVDGTDFIPSS